MKESPCKGCEDREHGCHDRCMGYRKWKGELQKQKSELRQVVNGLVQEIGQYESMNKPKKGGNISITGRIGFE